MAEEKEVDVPGIGRVKSSYVIAAVAAAAGFIAFAWWRRKSSNEVPGMIPVVDPSQIPANEYVPPGGSGATGHQDLTGDAITTNAEWFQAAADYLGRSGGWENKLINVALGKFLERKELTPEEADVVRSARGAVGDPPVNRPWTIVVGVTPAPERTLGKVTNLRSSNPTRNSVQLQWSPVAGAEGYRVEWEGETGKFHTRFDRTPNTTYVVSDMPLANHEYILNVSAYKGDEQGPTATIRVRTTG